ncbi:MAG: DUF4900 domain-containing protein [Candidatus Omnitrophota bacterium]
MKHDYLYSFLRTRKSQNGSVLIISLIVFTILFMIGQTFLSRVVNERKLTELELTRNQAFYLAEGAKNVALAELRQRTTLQLDTHLRGVSNIAHLQSYLPISRSLEFLRDYAYESNSDARFALDNPGWGDRAYLVLSRPDAETGSYDVLLEVFTNGDPAENPPEVLQFPYRYQISAFGTSALNGIGQQILSSGTFIVIVQRDNFARYALFTDEHTSPSGGIVWFTNQTNFTGPVHSNDRFSFAGNPGATFTDAVSQEKGTARFYNDRDYLLLDDNRNGDIDVPTFQLGFSRGVEAIPLPATTDKESQQRTALGLPGNQPIPSMSNGIYVPESQGALTGGIYVRGNAAVGMSVNGDGYQVYNVQQGSTAQQITVNPDANTTTVQEGAATDTYTGTPRGILFVDGSVQSFSGTLSNRTQLTVASSGDFIITNHVRYQNYATTPSLNATGYNNLLGALSWNGDIRIATTAPNDLDVHSTVMAPNGVFTVDNYDRGSPRGTVTLLGGAITENYGAFGTFNQNGPVSGYGRNFVYDSRMRQGYSPPYFPTATTFTATNNGVLNLPGWEKKRGHAPP